MTAPEKPGKERGPLEEHAATPILIVDSRTGTGPALPGLLVVVEQERMTDASSRLVPLPSAAGSSGNDHGRGPTADTISRALGAALAEIPTLDAWFARLERQGDFVSINIAGSEVISLPIRGASREWRRQIAALGQVVVAFELRGPLYVNGDRGEPGSVVTARLPVQLS